MQQVHGFFGVASASNEICSIEQKLTVLGPPCQGLVDDLQGFVALAQFLRTSTMLTGWLD